MKNLLPIFLIGLMLFSCGKDDNQRLTYDERLEIDTKIIEDYLSENNLTAEEGDFGLRYIIDEPGTGEFPTQTSTVIVKFKGYYPDGEVFDEAEVFQAALSSTIITGWRLGIPVFKKGGKGTLLLPSSLGYGEFPPTNSVIPPNQVLLFDIELINFQ